MKEESKSIEYKACLLSLSSEFKACQKAFAAIGDETRQHIILSMLEGECNGMRVGEITKRSSLSRPAVSHHIKILMEAGIIGMRREGTRNYYFVDYSLTELNKIEKLFTHIRELVKEAPNRSGE